MNFAFYTFRRGFGGKFGALVTEHFKAEFMGDLVQYTQQQLMSALGEKSGYVQNIEWVQLLRPMYSQANAKANFFFDLCSCSM